MMELRRHRSFVPYFGHLGIGGGGVVRHQRAEGSGPEIQCGPSRAEAVVQIAAQAALFFPGRNQAFARAV